MECQIGVMAKRLTIAAWTASGFILVAIVFLGLVAYPRCSDCPPGFSCYQKNCYHVGYYWRPSQIVDNAVYWANPEMRFRRRCLGDNLLNIPCDPEHALNIPS